MLQQDKRILAWILLGLGILFAMAGMAAFVEGFNGPHANGAGPETAFLILTWFGMLSVPFLAGGFVLLALVGRRARTAIAS